MPTLLRLGPFPRKIYNISKTLERKKKKKKKQSSIQKKVIKKSSKKSLRVTFSHCIFMQEAALVMH